MDIYNEKSTCKFCEIQNMKKFPAISDTILYENDYFFVIPALGCFLSGYIMIVSKRHIDSMSYLSETEKSSLEEVTNMFRSLLKHKYGSYPIVFEHGAANDINNMSACCIKHAHIHLIPYQLNNEFDMINSLGLKRRDSYQDFYTWSYDKPYLFFMDNSGSIYADIIDNSAIPSQAFRKWIAKDIGQPSQWDWRVYPFEDNIIATINDIQTELKNSRFKDNRLKNIYYCRAIDGLETKEVCDEYAYVQDELQKQGRILVNPFFNSDHSDLEINKHNSYIVVSENLSNISKADCVIVNLSIKGHTYVGCIAEMIYAKIQNCYIIVVCGDNNVNKHFYTLYHADLIIKNLSDLFEMGEWN